MNEEDEILGLSLTPTTTINFPVLISESFESNSTLNEIFVTFNIGGTKVLGKLLKPKTINPLLDESRSQELFDYLKRFGPYGGLDGPDSRLATCEIIGFKDRGELIKLQNAPSSQILVKLATKNDLEYFFGRERDVIKMMYPRGAANFLLPIDPKTFFLHADIVAPTGAGKTYIGAILAVALNGKNIGVINKEGGKEIRKIKTWILDITGQIAEDGYGIFKNLKDDPRMIIHLEELQIESAIELAAAIEQSYQFDKMPFRHPQIKSLVCDWMRMFLENKKKWDYYSFLGILRESIEKAYKDEQLAKRTIVQTMDRLETFNGENIWEKKIEQRLKAPYSIEDLCTYADQGKMIVFDLTYAEPYEKPIFASVLLKKLYDKAIGEYSFKRTEYGFSTIVFIDEVQDYCPQDFPAWYQEDCKPLIIDIAKKGRKFGLGLVLMTQRYAGVDKEALTQMNTHFTGNVTYGDRTSVQNNQGVIAEDLNSLRLYEFYFSGLACPISKMIIKGVPPEDVQRIIE